jgi:hypothetical protein
MAKKKAKKGVKKKRWGKSFKRASALALTSVYDPRRAPGKRKLKG